MPAKSKGSVIDFQPARLKNISDIRGEAASPKIAGEPRPGRKMVDRGDDKSSDEVPRGDSRKSRGRPRQGQALARQLPRDEELLKIAAELLYKKGFEGLGLSHIANAAGIGKNSLYHYFPSKEAIYERLVKNVLGRMNLEAEMTGPAPARERLAHLLRTRLETTVEYPLEVGLLSRELVRLEGPAGDWARGDPKRYFIAVRRIIIQGQKEGSFRAVDPDITASMIVGILAQIPNWYRLGGRITPDALVSEVIEFILIALLNDPLNNEATSGPHLTA